MAGTDRHIRRTVVTRKREMSFFIADTLLKIIFGSYISYTWRRINCQDKTTKRSVLYSFGGNFLVPGGTRVCFQKHKMSN